MNKLAFFSTSSRPIKALEELSKNFDIKLIVTKTDKIIGRNKEKTPNDVKLFAIKNNIELFEIDKFNKESKFLLKETLEKLQVDLAVTFDFGFIYDADRDAFIPPKPFDSWILNDATCWWEAPIPMPTDGKYYIWDVSSLGWVEPNVD